MTSAIVPASNNSRGSLVPSQRLDHNPAAVYLAGLAAGSVPTQRSALNTIAVLVSPGLSDEALPCLYIEWHKLTYAHTTAIRNQLAARYSPSTANRMLAALRGVLKECWRLRLMSEEDRAVASDLKPVRGRTLPKGRALATEELRRLLEACERDTRPAGRRDAAMLAVLSSCGLRRSELVGLDVGDWDDITCTLYVRHGKGNKARECYLHEQAADYLSTWVKMRNAGANTGAIGPLFVGINKAGVVSGRRLTDQSVADILWRRAEQAGVLDRFTPHDLRRTFVSTLLAKGADLATVQDLAGHSNPATTKKYDRRGDERKRRAVGLLGL